MTRTDLFDVFRQMLTPEMKGVLLERFLCNDLVGINITDAKGRTLYLNDAHTRITGHPKEQYFGTSMIELEAEGLVNESAAKKVIETGEEVSLEQSTSDGKSFEVRGIPIFDHHGELLMVLCALTDATEIVKNRIRISEMEEYTDMLRKALSGDDRLIYQSNAMQKVMYKAKRIAATDASVLVAGPSGIGKELIADIIQENSQRNDKPFLKVNCGAIPEKLLEIELFGYDSGKGSKGKKGILEAAGGGTVLLDEISELPQLLQSKLLRALNDMSITRIGGSRPIKVNFRLISTTNVDLAEKVRTREFREDLYYRINIIEIDVPSLDSRREDIPLLINHFIRLFNAKYDLDKKIDSDALSFLSQYDYPGNVRELRNIIERLVLQSQSEYISIRDAYESLGIRGQDEDPGNRLATLLTESNRDLSLKEIMDGYEKAVLQEYIKIYKTGTELARFLKTDQSTISRKLKRYGIRY